MAELLRTEGLSKHFRGLVANDDIDFAIESGTIRCIIGPNGAGKTTFLSMISGHLAPSAGRIIYKGADITRRSVIQRASIGIGRKFQTPMVFNNLTTAENVELSILRLHRSRQDTAARVDQVLQAVRLTEQRDTLAKHLSHGQRQWLEIGLLLGNESELLLLDEPTAGMTAEETAATGQLVRQLAQDRNLSVIIIEHDIGFIRDLKSPVTVLHLGRVLKEGSFEEIADDPKVRDVYLGADL
ncbi:ATP-binding cassette domain-containing protein [Rhodoligotrophos defluvii]|uniref:ATP-binding cassette domain-containing protein n=1 Tax=Rhodoligotrophos defluvii TaxID=2561934 RepID=UPI0010C958B5|nr:ATP-binding cassette domain-containing protein [Rhodoligotrophos defluvii]